MDIATIFRSGQILGQLPNVLYESSLMYSLTLTLGCFYHRFTLNYCIVR